MSQHQASWLRLVQSKPKLYLYETFKLEYSTENYCLLNMSKYQRSLIAKLRLGVLPINIEIGRYSGLPREERYCPLCNNTEVETEIHAILYCPSYRAERSIMIDHAKSVSDTFDRLTDRGKIGFLTSNNNTLRKTARFISEMLKIRENILRK